MFEDHDMAIWNALIKSTKVQELSMFFPEEKHKSL